MLHTCDNCIHRYIPESPYDYFKKTLTVPNLCHWGDKNFDLDYWLCDSLNVSTVNNVGNKLLMKLCKKQNFYGECPYFKTSSAIDIIPTAIEISPSEDTEVELNSDNVVLTVSIVEDTTSTDEKQDITYKYQWYKNGRKLYAKTKTTLEISTDEESADEYYCEVTQAIENNGDGGEKKIVVKTNTVKVTVYEKDSSDTN